MTDTMTMATPSRPRTATLDFEGLYRSSRDDLFAYVCGLLRDRSAAEDVTAQAFERAFRKQRRFDERRGNPRAWLFGIARNAALDELRRRGRHAAMVAEPEDFAAATAGEDAAERSLRREAVRAAMATLQARDRELVALKFFAGLSNGEIATVIDVTESNAGTMVHRAVQKLRKACDATL